MKYIITESRINSLISKYLDSIKWRLWDIGDGEFDLSDGYMDNSKMNYRLSSSYTINDVEVIYLNYDFVAKLCRLFSIDDTVVIAGIIDWFNKRYNKNLKINDWQYQDEEEEEDHVYED